MRKLILIIAFLPLMSIGQDSTILFKGGNDGKPLLDMQISKFDVGKIGNRRINGMGTLTFSEELNMDQYEIAVLYIVERGGIQKPKSIQFPKIKKTTKDQKTVKEILWGKYPGIGIQYKRSIDGYISVIATTMGGPSEKAGIQSGDLIIEINGITTKLYTHLQSDLPKRLGAKKGTSVDLKIRRGITDPFDVTVITVDIPLVNENIQYYSQFNIGEYGDDFYVLISEKNQKNMVKVKEIVKKANKKMHKSFFENSKVDPSVCIDISGTYEGEGDFKTWDLTTMKWVYTGLKTEYYLKIDDDCSVYYRDSTPSKGWVNEGIGTVNKTRDELNIYLGDDLGYFTPSIIIENDSYGNKMIKCYNNHTNEINFILKCKSGCDRDRIIPSYLMYGALNDNTGNRIFAGFYSTIGEFLELNAKEVNKIYNVDMNYLSPYKKYYYKKELRDAKLYRDFKVVITYQVKTDIPELELSGIDTFTWKFKDDIFLVYDHSSQGSRTFNRDPYFNITFKTKGLDINKIFSCCSDEFLDWDFAEIIETLNQGIKSKEINSIYFRGNINSVNREISSKEDAGKLIGSLFTRRGNKDGEYFLIKKRPTLFSNPQYWGFNDEPYLYSFFHIVDSDSLTETTYKSKPLDDSDTEKSKPLDDRVSSTISPAMYERTYITALFAYENGELETAVTGFAGLVMSDPSNVLADNSQYWLGECYYTMKNYKRAIIEFEKVFMFPGTDKADEAHLKLGHCHRLMGNIDKAREEYQILIHYFPGSKFYDEGRESLKQLKIQLKYLNGGKPRDDTDTELDSPVDDSDTELDFRDLNSVLDHFKKISTLVDSEIKIKLKKRPEKFIKEKGAYLAILDTEDDITFALYKDGMYRIDSRKVKKYNYDGLLEPIKDERNFYTIYYNDEKGYNRFLFNVYEENEWDNIILLIKTLKEYTY